MHKTPLHYKRLVKNSIQCIPKEMKPDENDVEDENEDEVNSPPCDVRNILNYDWHEPMPVVQ